MSNKDLKPIEQIEIMCVYSYEFARSKLSEVKEFWKSFKEIVLNEKAFGEMSMNALA